MTVEQLDYPHAKILMEATTQVELEFRVHACAKEPWTVAMIERMEPGDVLYDIGANVGAYTLVAAARGLRVVAVEPGFANYGRLCQNLAMNFDGPEGLEAPKSWLGRVVAIHGALAHANGLAWLDYHDLRPGGASHHYASQEAVFYHRQPIASWSLDQLVFSLGLPQPTHVKIDVDGAEAMVLAGGAGILSGGPSPDPEAPAWTPPREIMVELAQADEAALVEQLQGLGWTLAERYHERDGHSMGPMAYGLFTRAA